ncbi:MAG TPA: LapA family protein [Tepidisphaeraceae bacterium]|nr:LapA family protein [Tepidisphaeraceae bacterium]
MGNLWLKIKIWFKATLVAALLVYIILFTYFNASEKAHFWYWFHHQPETTLLVLVLCAFLAGVVASFLIGTTFRTMRQIHELQNRSRAQRLDRQIADIHSKAAMLQTKPAANPTTLPAEDEPGATP